MPTTPPSPAPHKNVNTHSMMSQPLSPRQCMFSYYCYSGTSQCSEFSRKLGNLYFYVHFSHFLKCVQVKQTHLLAVFGFGYIVCLHNDCTLLLDLCNWTTVAATASVPELLSKWSSTNGHWAHMLFGWGWGVPTLKLCQKSSHCFCCCPLECPRESAPLGVVVIRWSSAPSW